MLQLGVAVEILGGSRGECDGWPPCPPCAVRKYKSIKRLAKKKGNSLVFPLCPSLQVEHHWHARSPAHHLPALTRGEEAIRAQKELLRRRPGAPPRGAAPGPRRRSGPRQRTAAPATRRPAGRGGAGGGPQGRCGATTTGTPLPMLRPFAGGGVAQKPGIPRGGARSGSHWAAPLR